MASRTQPDASIIDCCVHHSWASESELLPYLERAWREYIVQMMPPNSIGVRRYTGTSMSLRRSYRNPEGDSVDEPQGPDRSDPGTDVVAVGRHLDKTGVGRALLCHGAGMLLPCHPSARVAVELVRAINDWTAERWLAVDQRLHGAVLIPTQLPELAAQEIRRCGANPRMVGVLMGANPLGKPFGHPIYDPIYKAAADLGLTVIVHSGGDLAVDTLGSPTAAGMPGTYAAYHVLTPQALMSHVVTLIGQGVPERYPSLQFLILGGSAAWLIPQLWRFDTDYKAFRLDAPWLKSTPSTYFRKSFKVGTFPFDYAASADQLATYFGSYPGVEEIMCFASGYPDWDSDIPQKIEDAIPRQWHSNVMTENARHWFRWDLAAAHVGSSSNSPRLGG